MTCSRCTKLSPKIAHVIHSGAIGGGPAVVLALARHVPARHLIAAPADGPLLDDAAAVGVETHELVHAGKWSFALSHGDLRRLARWADIVHVHGQFAGFYAGPLARSAGGTCLYTAHFPSFVTDRGFRTTARNWSVERVSCAAATQTIACSDWTRQEYVRRRLVDPRRVVTIYNGVPDAPASRSREETRRALGLPDDAHVVLCMGRFTSQKGFDIMLDAFPQVLAQVPSAFLILVGDGENRADLERQSQTLAISARTIFTGFRRDTVDLLGATDVVAVPSRYDVFPLVPLEAMMGARAVVASNIPVMREAVQDGVTGLLTELNPMALAAGVVRLLQERRTRESMENAARERALRLFSVQRMAAGYSGVYADILERRG